MGRRGPQREPNAAKLARGETRPSRLRNEPVAPLRAPRMPSDMDRDSQAVWRRVTRDAPPGLIRAAHADILRCFCEAVTGYVRAQRELSGSPLLIEGRTGLVRNPLHQIARDSRDAVRLLGRELGLSPAAAAAMALEVGMGQGPDIDDEIGPPTRQRFRVVGAGDA